MTTLYKWKAGKFHEWRLIQERGCNPEWELHYLPCDDGILLRYASEYEAVFLYEIRKLTLELKKHEFDYSSS